MSSTTKPATSTAAPSSPTPTPLTSPSKTTTPSSSPGNANSGSSGNGHQKDGLIRLLLQSAGPNNTSNAATVSLARCFSQNSRKILAQNSRNIRHLVYFSEFRQGAL